MGWIVLTTTQRNTLLVFAGTVGARVVFHFLTGFVADDAYITFRYSRNLAEGLGFVYNPGEPVLGTSTPLFTLILALFMLFKIPPVTAALGLSLFSSGLTAVILYRFALSLRFTLVAVVPALAYMLWPRSLVGDTCGMETAFFTLLVTAAFYYQHRRMEIYALGAATLATVTRPEGGILLLLLFAYNLYLQRDRWLAYVMIPVGLLGPWCLFAWSYFGSPVPNSVPAKLALYSRFGAGSPFDNLVYLMAWHNPFGWIIFLAAIAGVRWLNKKQNSGRLETVWVLAMVCFFTFSNSRVFFWYVVPIYPIYLLLASATLPPVIDWLRGKTKVRFIRSHSPGKAVLLLVLAVVLGLGSYRPMMYYREYQVNLDSMHRQVGLYLHAHAEPEAVVAAEDIGYMGYYSGRYILDRDGLVSPEMHDYNRQGLYLDAILKFSPDWLVAAENSPISPFLTDSLFLQRFTKERSFSNRDWTYVVFSSQEQSSE